MKTNMTDRPLRSDTDDDPSSSKAVAPRTSDNGGNGHSTKRTNGNGNGHGDHGGSVSAIRTWLRSLVRSKGESGLREAIEEYIEENESEDGTLSPSVSAHEKSLLSNILQIREHSVVDVMIPRADIVAVEIGASEKELLSLLAEKQFSRIPVYRETLDNVVGTIHIKDILSCLASGEKVNMKSLLRDVPIVAPSMHILDLLLLMRHARKHMALVVDEFGGIDGLITIGDVIEDIIGDIDDEYDTEDEPQMSRNADGSLLIDARMDIEEFEDECGAFVTEEEREHIDTLGGLVFALAGRVPARGEILCHEPSGIEFEVVDADPRKINRLLIRNLPLPDEDISP